MENLSIQVYKFLQTIPKGKVVTYGQIAEELGNKNLSRIIGNILHINPDPIKYPCYKVVNHKGELITIQKERLEKDGIIVNNYKVNLKIYQYKKTLNNYTIENYLKK